MESLTIKDFLIIKYAEIEIKKINVIIGEQSTGKSIIAKLVFLFETFLFLKIKFYAFNAEDQKAIRRMVLQDFEQLFPRYAWKDQSFKISYTFKNTTFTIERHKESSDGYYKLTFTYSENFKQLYNRIIRQIRRLYGDDSLKSQEINSKALEYIENNLSASDLFKDREGFIPAEIFFIPASRTLFVKYFTNNIFAFLANNFDLDPLIINFGSNYENAQRLYRIINEFQDQENDQRRLYDQIKLITEKILSGSYGREKDQDWLYHADGRKINLIDASSGQQEALPMLLILLVFSFFPDSESNQFFIEEPETHLFPSAQRDMVELFTLLYANKNCRFFLTTHSPYILTALNNKIMAANVEPVKAEKSLGYKNTIQFQDVSAYTISNGQTQSILDTEVNLIGINNLDAVSDELSQEFEEILERKAQQ
ncbi:MAG: AAA family ATPase [Microcystis aeruginosa]